MTHLSLLCRQIRLRRNVEHVDVHRKHALLDIQQGYVYVEQTSTNMIPTYLYWRP